MVMEDRGFDITALASFKMCSLEHTTFLRGKEQLSLEEKVETGSIASACIHVERAIEWVKNYRILQGAIPISLHAQLEMKFGVFVAYILTNFPPALVSNLVILYSIL